MQIPSGYKTITPIQLANILGALEEGRISAQDMRVYFACFASVAVREAAARYRKKRREQPKTLPRFQISEFEKMTGLGTRQVKGALRDLSREGLVNYGEGEIVITKESAGASNELLTRLSGRRSPKRPIPMPRALFRFLAQNSKSALSKVMLAYVARGLSISMKDSVIKSAGTAKISWIAETMDLSERAVRYARTELVGLGWIERDTQSFQRKLNRDGAYFVIDLAWGFSSRRKPQNVSNFAPLPPEKCMVFAPPRKDRETSYEVKNQKTLNSEPSGFCKGEGTPRIQEVQAQDLCHFGRLEVLYTQAVEAEWIRPCEANALNFVAAAVRAREVGRDPARVFVTLVRKRLWHHITQAQEEKARKTLCRFREQNADRFSGYGPERKEACGWIWSQL